MNRARKIAIAMSLALLILGVAGSFMTRGVMEHLPFLHRQKAGWNEVIIPHGIVDQRPWQTAATLATLAVSTEERELAREAERLADHEVDQAFSQSLRQASAETRELKGEALALQHRVTELQRMVKEDQAIIAALTAKGGVAEEGNTGSAGDDLNVAKAQLGLDQSELSDSLEDLARESGDQRVKIQQELSSREAAMKKYDAQAAGGEAQTAVTAAGQYNTLAGQLSEWWAQRSRKQLIEQAEQLAMADVAALTEDRIRLEAEAAADEKNAAMGKSAGQTNPDRVNQLQRLAAQRNI